MAEELVGIGGSRFVGFGPNRGRSVPDAIGQFLSESLKKLSESDEAQSEGEPQLELGLAELTPVTQLNREIEKAKNGKIRFNLCPACGMYTFGYFEGCAKCISCGHSEC